MVDVSAQSCTINPTSPDGLDPTGGVLGDGTTNVMIECTCVDENGDTPHRIRWFGPNMKRLFTERHTLPSDPYFINGHRVVTLVIPTFSNSTSGAYACGIDIDYPPPGMVTINLMLHGKSLCLVSLIFFLSTEYMYH